MHDHNLDDLILDPKPGGASRAKNILALLALFIIVLIAGIVVSKIFMQEPKLVKNDDTDISRYVSDDLTLQTNDSNDKKLSLHKEDEAFIDIPEPSLPAHSKEKPSSSLSKSSKTAKQNKTAVTSSTTPPNRTTSRQTTSQSRKTAKSTTPKATATTQRYYIQVGSFSKKPQSDSPLLQSLQRQGYRYTVYQTKGMYKILVGPYKTRASADQAIGKVRAHITRGAFVFTK